MIQATLPPTIEVREYLDSKPAGETFWSRMSSERMGWWKASAFSRISQLEHSGAQEDFGEYRATARAANQLRLYIDRLTPIALPAPSVVPISGHGLMAEWVTGQRRIEVMVFADGEVVQEAVHNNEPNADLSQLDQNVLFSWLVSGHKPSDATA
jgi:hypothetical protein